MIRRFVRRGGPRRPRAASAAVSWPMIGMSAPLYRYRVELTKDPGPAGMPTATLAAPGTSEWRRCRAMPTKPTRQANPAAAIPARIPDCPAAGPGSRKR